MTRVQVPGFNEDELVVVFEIKHRKIVDCVVDDTWANRKFKGRAKCHNDDAFNIREGRSLALNRALEKRDAWYDREINNTINDYITFHDQGESIIKNKLKGKLKNINQ